MLTIGFWMSSIEINGWSMWVVGWPHLGYCGLFVRPDGDRMPLIVRLTSSVTDTIDIWLMPYHWLPHILENKPRAYYWKMTSSFGNELYCWNDKMFEEDLLLYNMAKFQIMDKCMIKYRPCIWSENNLISSILTPHNG